MSITVNTPLLIEVFPYVQKRPGPVACAECESINKHGVIVRILRRSCK